MLATGADSTLRVEAPASFAICDSSPGKVTVFRNPAAAAPAMTVASAAKAAFAGSAGACPAPP